jgi:alpha-tubulin suppressor-like RCC1 family protein
VWCWGTGFNGGTGDGQYFSRHEPTMVLGGGADAIAVGSSDDAAYEWDAFERFDLDLSCALIGGEVTCWGDDRYGSLGEGTTTMATAPQQVAGLAATDLAVGEGHACVIGTGGGVSCWGDDQRRQIGDAIDPTCPPGLNCGFASPVPVGYVGSTVDAIAAGNVHACAHHDGDVTCWGSTSTSRSGQRTCSPATTTWRTAARPTVRCS